MKLFKTISFFFETIFSSNVDLYDDSLLFKRKLFKSMIAIFFD